MPPQPTPAEPAPAAAHTDAERYCGILREIIDIGLRHIRATDPANTPAEPAGDPQPGHASRSNEAANTYDRLTRSVRRSMMLADHLANPKPAQTTQATAPADQRTAARKKIIRAVEDTIEQRVAEQDKADARAELRDRVESEDFEHDLATRSVEDIIKDIERDFGIAPLPGLGRWRRRTPADVQDLHDLAAQPPAGAPRPPRTTPKLVPTPPREPPPPPDGLADDMRLALALLGETAPVHDPPS